MKKQIIGNEFIFSLTVDKELEKTCLFKTIIHIDGRNYIAYKIK
jgi:hypothetical protein